jgi:hypothetical protein
MIKGQIAIPLIGFNCDKLVKPFDLKGLQLMQLNDYMGKHFCTPKIIFEVGNVFMSRIMTKPVFYCNIDATKDIDIYEIADASIGELDLFFIALWFIKDNSLGYPFKVVYNELIDKVTIIGPEIQYYNHAGEVVETAFTDEEMQEALNMVNKLHSVWPSIQNESKFNIVNDTKTRIDLLEIKHYNLFNRGTRAIQIMVQARSENFALMRISMLINVLECLFTTDASELAHRISEKVASYLSKDKIERAETYKFIKKCYNTRSKFYHGQDVESKLTTPDLYSDIQKLEETLRKILKKVIYDDFEKFALQKIQFDEWLLSLLFDVSSSQSVDPKTENTDKTLGSVTEGKTLKAT